MEVVEDVGGIPEDILKDLASKDIAEEPQAKPKQKKEEKSSAWGGLKKKKELNEEILKEIQKKLAEAWELMGTEYGRKLIEDVAVEVKKLCIINDLP